MCVSWFAHYIALYCTILHSNSNLDKSHAHLDSRIQLVKHVGVWTPVTYPALINPLVAGVLREVESLKFHG